MYQPSLWIWITPQDFILVLLGPLLSSSYFSSSSLTYVSLLILVSTVSQLTWGGGVTTPHPNLVWYLWSCSFFNETYQKVSSICILLESVDTFFNPQNWYPNLQKIKFMNQWKGLGVIGLGPQFRRWFSPRLQFKKIGGTSFHLKKTPKPQWHNKHPA